MESVKHAYSTDLKISSSSILNSNEGRISRNYKPTLREMLLNIRNEIILKTANDSVLAKLNRIILTNNRTNPFEKLEENQKYFFKNIMTKSDTDYAFIEDDLMRISDELDTKNKLVVEYLANARGAYRNSMIAISISFLSFLFAILLNKEKLWSGFQKR